MARGVVVAVALGLWFSPAPEGLVPAAWHPFALFVAAIVSVVIDAFPILTSPLLPPAACGLLAVFDRVVQCHHGLCRLLDGGSVVFAVARNVR